MELGKIWDGWALTVVAEKVVGGDKQRARNRKLQHRADQITALNIAEGIGPGLVSGVQNLSLKTGQVNEIMSALPKELSGHRLKKTHNFLVRGFLRGVKHRSWKMQVPARMINIRRDSSPYRPNRFHQLRTLERLNAVFQKSMEDSVFFTDAADYCGRVRIRKESPVVTAKQLQAGQIIYSAIVNGALLNKKWLACLGEALSERLVIDGGFIWMDLIELVDESKKDKIPLFRRWFPDPVTALLILRWRKQYERVWVDELSKKGAGEQCELLLARYFRAVGVEKSDRVSIKQLMEMAETRLSINLPRFLVCYSKKFQSAPSLPAASWHRFISNRRFTYSVKKDESDQLAQQYSKNYSRHSSDQYPDQIKKYREIRGAFSAYHHKTANKVGPVAEKIEVLLVGDDISPLLRVLGEWSIAMMRSQRVTGNKVKPNSAATYLSTIGRDLILNGVELELDDLSAEDWRNLYDKVLESAKNPELKSKRNERLATFHGFLVENYQAPFLYFEKVDGGKIRVASNIVSQYEYNDVMARIFRNTSYSQRLRTQQRLLLMLGFRCGLRSQSEALSLQLVDLQRNVSHLELIVRNNEYGTVKSDKSTRRIPLITLLSKAEYAEFYAWVQLRQREVVGQKIGNQLLFCRQGEDFDSLTPKGSINSISQTMRAVTGDETLTFHSLRHSCANHMLLRLLADDFPGIAQSEWVQENLPETPLRSVLLAQTAPLPTKKTLYAISQILGHIDPKETLDSYFHLMDYVLGHALKSLSPVLSKQVQENLLGLSHESLKVTRNRFGLKKTTTASDLLAVQFSRYKHRFKNPLYKLSKEVKPLTVMKKMAVSYVEPSPPLPSLLYDILRRHYQRVPVSLISQQYGFSQKQIRSWVASAKRLAGIEGQRGSSRHISRQKNILDRAGLPSTAIIPGYCPAKPRAESERYLVKKMSDALFSLYQKKPELVERGVRLFLQNATTSHMPIKFCQSEDVKFFVVFLRKTGVPVERIRVSTYSSVLSEEQADLKYWVKYLKLPKENISQPDEIKIVDTVRACVRISAPRDSKSDKNRAQMVGVRFVIYMAAIALNIGVDLEPARQKTIKGQGVLFKA